MQSRGIKKEEAIIMLVYAFINEISNSTETVHDDVIKEVWCKKFFNLRVKRGGSLFHCSERTRCMGAPQRGFVQTIGLKCWNILAKLGEKVDFSTA